MRSFFYGKNGGWNSWSAVYLSVLMAAWICLPSCNKQTRNSLPDGRAGISHGDVDPYGPDRSRPQQAAQPDTDAQQRGRHLDELLLSVPSSNQTSALEDIIYENAATNPQLSCTAFRRLQDNHTLNPDVTRFLAAALARFDPEEAWLWMQQLPSGPHRKIAIGELCLKIAPEEPAHAADLATLNLPLADGHESVFLRIARDWSATNPLAAAEWVGRFPTGTARTESLKTILANWDPDAASSWASTLSDNSLRAEIESLITR